MSRLPLSPLRDGDLSVRAARVEDAAGCLGILADPEVQAWWNTQTVDDIRAWVAAAELAVIEHGGELCGVLLCDETVEDDWRVVGFDIAVGAGQRGRHVGRRALRLAIDFYVRAGHHRFTIDPAAENDPAIRCYRATGFRDVGLLRRAWLHEPSGRWHDCLLMDLLADDLGPGPDCGLA